MIVISAVLVVAAFGLLIAGITLPLMVLVYVSIGVSVLAALLLGAGAFKRRGELFGDDTGMDSGSSTDSSPGSHADGDTDGGSEVETSAPQEQASRQDALAVAARAGAADTRGESHESLPERHAPAGAAGTDPNVPGDAVVVVAPFRGTYHLANCRQLRTRETHDLTYAEAREQGYVACASCLPDTVLAARGSAAADATVETTTPSANEDDTSSAEPAGDESADNDSDTHAGLVGVVSGSHRYHRLTCAVVEDAVNDGIELTTMGRDEAEAAECTRCTVCRP